jgi:hypothetical protein
MKSVNGLTATILRAIASVSIANSGLRNPIFLSPYREPLMHKVMAQRLLVMQRMSKKET